jgi:hypothetical protein
MVKTQLTISILMRYVATLVYLGFHTEIRKARDLYTGGIRDYRLISRKWYEALNPCIDVDWIQLQQIFARTIDLIFNLGTQSTLDETIFESSLDSALLVNIKTKPHPLGILTWMHAQRIKAWAFVVYFIIRAEDRVYSVRDVVKGLLRIRHPRMTHVTADSWFNSTYSRAWLTEHNIRYTMAVKKSIFPYVWKVLLHHTEVNASNMAVHNDNMIAYAYKTSTKMHLLSTNFEEIYEDNVSENTPRDLYDSTSR